MQVPAFRYNGSVVYESNRVISLLSMQSFDQVMLAINQMINNGGDKEDMNHLGVRQW
jgi:hypothetical protein